MGVEVVGHQQRPRQGSEDPFDRPRPGRLVGLDLDELARERQAFGGRARGRHQRVPQRDQGLFQAGPLHPQRLQLALEPADAVAGVRVLAAEPVPGLPGLVALRQGRRGGVRLGDEGRPARLGRGQGEAHRVRGRLNLAPQLGAPLQRGALGRSVVLQRLQLPASPPLDEAPRGVAVVAAGALGVVGRLDLGRQPLEPRLQLPHLGRRALELARQPDRLEVLLLQGQRVALGQPPRTLGVDRPQGRQRVLLPTGIHDRAVRSGQLVELLGGRGHEVERVGLVEHELPQQGVEAREVLRRLRLVQQALGLVAGQSEPPLQARGEGRVRRLHRPRRVRRLEPPLVQAVLGEGLQPEQVDGLLGQAEDGRQVAGRGRAARQVEQPQHRGRTPLPVVIGQPDGAPGRARPQEGRRHLTRRPVGLALVGAAHVRHQAARPVGRPALLRRGVELQPARLHEDGREGVQQRRLARPRRARHQQAGPRHREVEIPVEGAPVDHLQPRQPVLARGDHDASTSARSSAVTASTSSASNTMPRIGDTS